jgi:zinc transport system ATP-binding protein
MSGVTLELWLDSTLLFSSKGKWIYPLFELEGFLNSSGHPPETLKVKDKVIGKAAALLLIRMGIGEIEAGVLSLPGRTALDLNGVRYRYAQLVHRIDCQTEQLLAGVTDPDSAYSLLRLRAKQKNPPFLEQSRGSELGPRVE